MRTSRAAWRQHPACHALPLTLGVALLWSVGVPGRAAAQQCDWSGVWQTQWGDMELTVDGTRVTGTYTQNAGRLSGVLQGNRMVGSWAEAPSYQAPADGGDMILTITPDCNSLSGQYWHGARPAGAGD